MKHTVHRMLHVIYVVSLKYLIELEQVLIMKVYKVGSFN